MNLILALLAAVSMNLAQPSPVTTHEDGSNSLVLSITTDGRRYTGNQAGAGVKTILAWCTPGAVCGDDLDLHLVKAPSPALVDPFLYISQ